MELKKVLGEGEEPDKSPLAKRSRPAENKQVEKPLDWDVVIANIRAMGKASNEATQSAPKAEVSRSRAPSESPCDPPTVSQIATEAFDLQIS